MCGISCIVDLRKQVSRDSVVEGSVKQDLSKEIESSLDEIDHRGPDARGHWMSKCDRVVLGHIRLAINDLSVEGAQPLHNSQNTIHAVVNGELYDYDNIRTELEKTTSYHFKSRSDSELVVALYEHHGLNFLQHLRGEFALVLYDESTQMVLGAKDRYGIKPLFWTVQNNRLLIASEMKAFLALGWKPRWDVKSLLDAGWNHDERTIFEGIQKIRPGHYLTCQSFGHIEQRMYWDITYPDKHIRDLRTPEELISGVRERLLEAVKLRLRADVPIGIYLSGGIDSSALAGIVTHLVKEQGMTMGSADAKQRIACFSIAFDANSGFDESAIADRTANWLGVKYVKMLMNEEELAKRFEDATWHAEHHNPDFNFVGKYALSEMPSEHGYKVVITGEGADENFGGYPMYLPDFLREPDLTWTKYNAIDEQSREQQLSYTEQAAKDYYIGIGADGSNRGPSIARKMVNDISTISSMAAFQLDIFAPWTKCYGRSDPQTTIAHNTDGRVRQLMADSWHPLHSAQYIWTKGHLANIFLTCLGDRTEMAHSVEARTPFLDHHLTEYVNHLPPSAKIKWDPVGRNFCEKWILREACKPFITKELYERKKHPYSAPTAWPAQGALHKLLGSIVTQENVEKLGFVDWTKCSQLVERAFVGQDSLAMRYATVVAEWVILGKRFGVEQAHL